MSSNATDGLEEQVRALTSRLYQLEETLRQRGILPPDKAPAPLIALEQPSASIPSGEPSATPAPTPPTAPIFTQHIPSSAQPDRSLENKIGSQWFNRIGILAVLIGMALFLKLAIDNHWIGPLGRVSIGLIAGAGLIAWSERFESKGYRAFSYSLKALGSGVLYLSLWAAFSLFHLIPSGVAFAAMIAVTAFNAFLCWIKNAELLALYAIVGGLTTPLLISTGGNHEIALFTYLLMLDLAVLVLVILRPWSRLLFAAFTGTTVFFLGWWLEFFSRAELTPTLLFLTCFFLIFALAPRLIRLETTPNTEPSRWHSLVQVVMPVLNAALGFFAYYSLFTSQNSTFAHDLNSSWSGAILAIIFAAFYLALIRIPNNRLLHQNPPMLASLHLTSAIVFLTIAIPLKAQGRWLTVGWLIEGAVLLWMASRQQSKLLRALALASLALGLISLFAPNFSTSLTPILNARFGTYCVAIAAFAFAAWISRNSHRSSEAGSSTWLSIAAASVLILNALILIALSLEIHNYWWSGFSLVTYPAYNEHRITAQFAYSALFMAHGAVLLAIGFWRRSAFVRWQALALIAFAIGKVFLVDVRELSRGYGVLSFFGLGALLLAISFAYQKDWLNLRNPAPPGTSDGPTA